MNKLSIIGAIAAIVGLQAYTVYAVKQQAYTSADQDYSTEFVAEECAKVGGTYAQGLTVSGKEVSTVALCIASKKGTGV